jgi:hypothetical protein
MKKITVISENGELVGIWIHPQSIAEGDPVSEPAAGPAQTLHHIEVEDPESYIERKAVPELTRMVKERLRLK